MSPTFIVRNTDQSIRKAEAGGGFDDAVEIDINESGDADHGDEA